VQAPHRTQPTYMRTRALHDQNGKERSESRDGTSAAATASPCTQPSQPRTPIFFFFQLFWRYCTPVVKNSQLFLQAARGKKLPENFSFVAGLEMRVAGCARPEIEEIEALAELVQLLPLTPHPTPRTHALGAYGLGLLCEIRSCCKETGVLSLLTIIAVVVCVCVWSALNTSSEESLFGQLRERTLAISPSATIISLCMCALSSCTELVDSPSPGPNQLPC